MTRTDEMPRLHRGHLVPSDAVGVPPAVLQASEELRVAALAYDQAAEQRKAADAAVKAAPRLDADADFAAVRDGKEPPKATVSEKEEALARARQREAASRRIADRQMLALDRVISEHSSNAWREELRQAIVAETDEMLAAVSAAEERLVNLERKRGILGTITSDAVDREHGRSFKPSPIRNDRTSARKLLAQLRALIEESVPPPPPTAQELAAQERLQETQRAWNAMSLGGATVL